MREGYHFARAGRAGREDVRHRTPELEPLASNSVAVFGLGCVGAPSVLELARAGVGELRILDFDVVDPGTVGRWPIGLSVAGMKKVEALRNLIRRDYPYTKVVPHDARLGSANPGGPEPSDWDVVGRMTANVGLIYDATAEVGVQQFLSDYAFENSIPYLGVTGTFGGWGGKVFRVVPGRTRGCWMCYRYAFDDDPRLEPSASPHGTVQPVGCAEPTFTGAGFDLAEVALAAVRIAVATLCAGHENGYPGYDWDVTTMSFRDREGRLIVPQFHGHVLQRHPRCPRCSGA